MSMSLLLLEPNRLTLIRQCWRYFDEDLRDIVKMKVFFYWCFCDLGLMK